jgi:hypothetical protein
MNPPYGRVIPAWMSKLVAEHQRCNVTAYVALVPARPDTEWFLNLADSTLCFIRGRLRFGDSDAGAPFPSVAAYAGPDEAAFSDAFAPYGTLWAASSMTSGLTRAGFDHDLAVFADRREGEFGSLLWSKDVYFVEQKTDVRCRETGNLFVEYEQPSGPSGLASSQGKKATHWVFEYDEGCFLIVPTPFLRRAAVRAYKDKKRRLVGGDYNRYKGVGVPIAWLLPPYCPLDLA